MKLLSTLKNQEANNCFILTYNLDLAFFEYLLFTPLYINGCRNVVIICDPTQYKKALEDISILRFVGQRYILVPANTSLNGVFHPKLIFITGENSGSVTITSGNLTRAGYTHNIEVGTHIQYSNQTPNPHHWSACYWAYKTISQIVTSSDSNHIMSARLDQLFSTTPWLRNPDSGQESNEHWLLHNLDETLFSQVARIIGDTDSSKVNEISILSPFFDPELRSVASFIKEYDPKKVEIYSKKPMGLDPIAIEQLAKNSAVSIEYQELKDDPRVLHAKVVKINTVKGTWVVSGSANMSAAAWLNTATKGNTEVISLRFESTSDYFVPWLNEVISESYKKPINEIVLRKIEPKEKDSDGTAILLSATLENDRITLIVDNSIEHIGQPKLHLKVGLSKMVLTDSTSKNESELVFHVGISQIESFTSPTLCWLEFDDSGIGPMVSNSVLINNLDSLTRYSKPLDKRPRPTISIGIEPDSYEHCVQLIEMMENLLARDKDGLKRHQRIAGKRDQGIEDQMVLDESEEEYEPAAHFVEEPKRLAQRTAGSGLYGDYFDRLTYDSLLSAVLQIVYKPPSIPHVAADTPPPTIAEDPPVSEETLEDIMEDAEKVKQLKRIESRANTLVNRFLSGLKDDQYLEDVPPAYLIETFYIIVSFLKIVWLNQYLSEEKFVSYVYGLLLAIWGWPGDDGAWKSLENNISPSNYENLEDRLNLSAHIWLTVYLLGKLFELRGDEDYYILASWARHAKIHFKDTSSLNEISVSLLGDHWRYLFPESFERLAPEEIANWLEDYFLEYDNYSLISEISAEPASRAEITTKNVSDLTQVPALLVKTPLSDDTLDNCLKRFQVFLKYPQIKKEAWAQFINVNPLIHPGDIKKVVIFFRSDLGKFEFIAVKGDDGIYDPDISKEGINLEDILKLETYNDLK